MTVNGIAYQLPTLAHLTGGIDGGVWPTPRASEYKGVGPLGSKSQRHMLGRNYLCAVAQEAEQQSGSLSSTWVCWLMGYPLDWLDIDGWQNPELEELPLLYLTDPPG